MVLLHSGDCNSILLLHSWEIELSIRYHATKINQLHDLNLTRYYIKGNIYIIQFVVYDCHSGVCMKTSADARLLLIA